MRYATWSTVGLALAAACMAPPAPVPLIGESPDLAKLVGKWEGEYSSSATGRSGSIVFELAAVGDTAAGEVVMIPRGWSRPLRVTRPMDERPAEPLGLTTDPELLRIEFVRIDGGRVSGTLSPYTDPDCGCTLRTTFVGRLDGDVIAGTFVSRHVEGGTTQSGRWKVERRSR